VPPRRRSVDGYRANAGCLAQGKQVPEAGVIAEVQPEPCLIEEDELAGDPELELALQRAEFFTYPAQLVQRFLNRRVLDRIQFQRAERRVKRDDEVSSIAADAGPAVVG